MGKSWPEPGPGRLRCRIAKRQGGRRRLAVIPGRRQPEAGAIPAGRQEHAAGRQQQQRQHRQRARSQARSTPRSMSSNCLPPRPAPVRRRMAVLCEHVQDNARNNADQRRQTGEGDQHRPFPTPHLPRRRGSRAAGPAEKRDAGEPYRSCGRQGGGGASDAAASAVGTCAIRPPIRGPDSNAWNDKPQDRRSQRQAASRTTPRGTRPAQPRRSASCASIRQAEPVATFRHLRPRRQLPDSQACRPRWHRARGETRRPVPRRMPRADLQFDR